MKQEITQQIKKKVGQKVFVQQEDGSLKEYTDREKAPNGKIYHNPNVKFRKVYDNSWRLLRTQLTDKEYVLADKLSQICVYGNNSIKPLSMEMSASELSRILDIDRKIVKRILNKFIQLGVIAKFTVSDCVNPSKDLYEVNEYLMFNPYLSFKGYIIDKGIADLFSQTVYALINK